MILFKDKLLIILNKVMVKHAILMELSLLVGTETARKKDLVLLDIALVANMRVNFQLIK